MRSLRVGLTLLAACKDDEDQTVACWFDAERSLGLYLLHSSHRRAIGLRLGVDAEESAEAIVEAGKPFYEWVEVFGGNMRLWHKIGAEVKDLKEQTDHAETLLANLKSGTCAG